MHPGVGDLSHFSDSEIEDKIIQLSRYYHTANDNVRSQLLLLIDTYKLEQENRKLQNKKSDSEDNDLDNLINVS